MSTEAMKLALEALEEPHPGIRTSFTDAITYREKVKQAITTLQEALAQPQDFSDAYQGAREDLAIWKKRALEAEELNRKFIADINGQTFMGEPAQQEPVATLFGSLPVYDTSPPAQPQQEPVAWRLSNEAFDYQITSYDEEQANTYIKNGWHLIDVLYTSPPAQRTWVGLTDKEAMQICVDCGCLSEDWLTLLDAIEAKLKEKNT